MFAGREGLQRSGPNEQEVDDVCPECGKRAAAFAGQKMSDAKILMDTYRCPCGYLTIEYPHIDEDGMAYLED